MAKFPQKRPRRQDYINKYGFEGDTYWRLDLLKYEDDKAAWDRREANRKAYRKKVQEEESNLMKKDDKKKKTATRAGQSSSSKAGKQTDKASTPAEKTAGKKRTSSTTSTSQSKTSKSVENSTKRAPAAKTSIPKKATAAKTDKTPAAPKKPAAVQKPAKPSKTAKAAGASKKPKLKPIKHSDAEENRIGGESPIHIVKAKPKEKPKQARSRVLKRVAKSGGYTVFDGPRSGKTFATQEEALNYAAYMLLNTGEALEVAPTTRQITHTFKAESESKK